MYLTPPDMKHNQYIFCGLLIVLVSACSFITPVVGDVALRFLTTKESDFNKMSVSIIAVNNTEPIDKTVASREQSRNWQTGVNSIAVFTSNPNGIGIVSFDGKVTVDGQETKTMSAQNFAFFPKDDLGTKTVRMTNGQGQSHEVAISIPPSISVTHVNGAAEGGEIDLSRPVTIRLAYDPELEGKVAVMSLVSNTGVGPTMLYNMVASFRVAPEVTIPAGAFRNPHTSGGISTTGASGVKFLEGDSYLQVRVRQIEHPAQNPGFVNYRLQRDSYATVPVKVTAQPSSIRNSVSINDRVRFGNQEFRYSSMISNGFISPPLSGNTTKLGIASLSVSAKLYSQTTTESSRENVAAGTITYTRLTTTFQFPQLDDVYWEQFLSNVHADLTHIFTNAGVQLVPTEQITSHPVYAEFYDVTEENTEMLLRKTYKNTKRLVPSNLMETFSAMEGANFFPEVAREYRLLAGTGMDAFLSLDMNFQVGGGENNTVVLFPTVNYTITGTTLAQDGTVSPFVHGNITGPGVPFSEADFQDVNGLDRATQRIRLMEIMESSVKGLVEAQIGMDAVAAWEVARRQ